MNNLLLAISIILLIIWAVTFFGGYYTGWFIHVLLLLAIICFVLKWRKVL